MSDSPNKGSEEPEPEAKPSEDDPMKGGSKESRSDKGNRLTLPLSLKVRL